MRLSLITFGAQLTGFGLAFSDKTDSEPLDSHSQLPLAKHLTPIAVEGRGERLLYDTSFMLL